MEYQFPAPGRPEAQLRAQRADGRWAEAGALQVAGRWVELRAQQVVAQACYTPMASDSTRAGRERLALVAGRRRAGLAWQAPLGWRGQLGLRRQYLALLVEQWLWPEPR